MRLPIVERAAHIALAACLACAPFSPAALAVSGGGKDYSGASLEGQDFSNRVLNGKEFRGAFAKNVDFSGASLKSTSFFQAALEKAVFAGADLTGASLEEAGLEGDCHPPASHARCNYASSAIDDALVQCPPPREPPAHPF